MATNKRSHQLRPWTNLRLGVIGPMIERARGAAEVSLVQSAEVPPAVTVGHRARGLAQGGGSLLRGLVGRRGALGRCGAGRAAQALLLTRAFGALLTVRCRGVGRGRVSDRSEETRAFRKKSAEHTG